MSQDDSEMAADILTRCFDEIFTNEEQTALALEDSAQVYQASSSHDHLTDLLSTTDAFANVNLNVENVIEESEPRDQDGNSGIVQIVPISQHSFGTNTIVPSFGSLIPTMVNPIQLIHAPAIVMPTVPVISHPIVNLHSHFLMPPLIPQTPTILNHQTDRYNFIQEEDKRTSRGQIKNKSTSREEEEVCLKKRINPSCELCGKQFITGYNLIHHIKEVHGGKRKTFTCGDCEAVFTRLRSLERHQNSVHLKNVPRCKVCQKKVVNVSLHYRKFHCKSKAIQVRPRKARKKAMVCDKAV